METYAAAAAHGLADRVRASQLPPPPERVKIRQESGASLRDFADELGVSPMTVLRWETGKSKPRMRRAIAYRRLLDAVREAAA
ncbi:helix-turn-helix domain-containing protein [Streptomyces luteogriseus]|uniref:helix-turn-helix domain-containing protein n=1 Tax=Streptomyces luteogriseus TaxID=68233 RepID=UPI0037B7738D